MADVLAKYRASAVIQLDLIAVNPDFKPSLTSDEANSISHLTVDPAERAEVAAISPASGPRPTPQETTSSRLAHLLGAANGFRTEHARGLSTMTPMGWFWATLVDTNCC